MANKIEKAKTEKIENKYSPVGKKKKLLTSEIKKVVGGRRCESGSTLNHNEICVII